ncbi:carboxymuconolactone decarboxylase family protein [Achromobacter aloeverae]
MARIPYADKTAPAIQPLAARIEKERGRILNLYAMLLNSPPIAEGWLNYLTAVRQKARLPARIRELMIMRVAVLNGAEYEFEQHMPFARREGLTEQQMQDLRSDDVASFSEAEQAALAYCDEMTRTIRVKDATFAALARHYAPQDIVDITATVAAYNMVSRFLEALQVDHD